MMNGQSSVSPNKKLIEVALPLEAINKASAREKSIRHGHPSTLHMWWARRPLAAARAVLFAQMVDDPSSHPARFATEEAQEEERRRLFDLIERLVQWENTSNTSVLAEAHAEIWNSWRATCADNVDHPRAKELFNPNKLPAFHDPFAGGGSLPFEAQRLGLEAYASDLNPVAVLINKAMIEIPSEFTGQRPVNPESRREQALLQKQWSGTQGLSEDVHFYGEWMRGEAEKRIGRNYPTVEVSAEMAKERPDLRPFVGRKLGVIAWLWARTVKSPNPAFSNLDVPLVSTFMLSTKPGKEVYVEPVLEASGYRFTLKIGKPKDPDESKRGTKLARGANFRCLMSGAPIAGDYIKAEGESGRMGVRLMAVIAEGDRGRIYLSPSPEMESLAHGVEPEWKPDIEISGSTQYLGVKPYGIDRFYELFTPRQLSALTTFSNLIQEAQKLIEHDALSSGMQDDQRPLCDGGTGARAYAEAVAVYLACALSRAADYWNSNATWEPSGEFVAHAFTRQAIAMVWDFAESNPFSSASGNWSATCVGWVERVIDRFMAGTQGHASLADAQSQSLTQDKIVSTDPPYFDNVPYGDLSDFFYIWLRRSIRSVFPDIFATVAVPKAEELVAFAYRHKDKAAAGRFFMNGMGHAMHRLAEQAHPAFPISIYYAFKQAETDGVEGTASTGWETFLDAVIRAGFAINGTWPIRTERQNRTRNIGSNALASSIILVCRPRLAAAPTATRREFLNQLKAELPIALKHLQRGNIAPVDLAQAAIGPGMAIYSRYARVLDARGTALSVREALTLINQALDEVLAEQEGDFDNDSRWAVAWFEQYGFADGEFGVADTLARAKNTSVGRLVHAGIVASKSGRVRLLQSLELSVDWDPATDDGETVWELVHQLIRVLETNGEGAVADMLAKFRGKTEIARELAYRLYTVCERKRRPKDALAYNGLVQSWPEIVRLSHDSDARRSRQTEIFERVEL